MPFINIIKYDGNANGEPWLVYKYPGEEIVLGSQLIVRQGQEALIFMGGEACDRFRCGTYVLNAANLSLIRQMPEVPAGVGMAFLAEIYYVNVTAKLDMRWGTQSPFQMEDPRYGLLLSIRAYGRYGLRIKDAKRFVSELTSSVKKGATLNYTLVASYFSGLLASSVKMTIAKSMAQNQISFLEVTAFLGELSRECEVAIAKGFERFGVKIENFYIESITPPKDEWEGLKKIKEEVALGYGFYKDKRSFDIMEKLADKPSSGSFEDAGKGLSMLKNGYGCPKCGFENGKGAKFCGNCGQGLLKICSKCGKQYGLGQNFCSDCGVKL